MLARAAGRRIQKSALRRNLPPVPSDSFFLPFLYPSYARDSAYIRHSSSSSLAPERTYATLAQSELINANDLPPLPVSKELLSPTSRTRRGSEPPSRVILIDSPGLANQVSYYRPEFGNLARSLSPDKSEIFATYHACLRVGRIARAQLMLINLSESLDKESPLLLEAHNAFLQALLTRALAKGAKEQHLTVFFVWYEDKMKAQYGVNGDVTTFAMLLKGSLAKTNKLHSQRYIKRFVNVWKTNMGSVGEVLESTVLSDQDVIDIAQICSLKVDELHAKRRPLFFQNGEDLLPHPITTIEEVKPTRQKGLGLEVVKMSLQSLIDPNSMPSKYAVDADDVAFQIERQKLLEEDSFGAFAEQWRQNRQNLQDKGVLSFPNSISNLVWQWHQALTSLIKEEVVRTKQVEKGIDRAGNKDRAQYAPYLQMLPPAKVASVVIIEALKLVAKPDAVDGAKASYLVLEAGKALEQEVLAMEIADKKNADIFGKLAKEELNELFRDKAQFRRRIKAAKEKLALNPDANRQDVLQEWPLNVKVKLGAVIISMLLHCAKQPVTTVRSDTGQSVTQYHPAFYHSYDYAKGKKIGVIRAHEDVMKRLGNDFLPGGVVGRLLPMLVPPRPWLAWDDGAYYYTQSRVVRTADSREQEIYVRAASARGDLEKVFEGLDVLGQTAWKVNKNVFDVVLKVWNTGEEFADIPPASTGLDIPPEPAPSADPSIRAKWVERVREMKLQEQNNHSQRCDINFKVEIARALLFENFYYPHNVDFRGRAYPIPPNLNHIGNDLSRGLLMFDEAKELGERGFYWLKVHLANLAGYDKASFNDRVEFANQHKDDIIDSAERPLEGRRWWLQAEDPWQCLAACFALTEAWRLPDPTKYECHIPVAQDGSCNGLQHYAALGGDMIGAKQVNLEPSDKPQDVYTGVAELVKKAVERDAKDGNKHAMAVNGHISRKIVKQTVMTNVYGVTFIGARAQIAKQLDALSIFPKENIRDLSLYVTRLVFESIQSMFTGATHIQNWLSRAARTITKSVGPSQIRYLYEDKLANRDNKYINNRNGKKDKKNKTDEFDFMTSVVWTTPLGLPVVQPYRKEAMQTINTKLQKIHVTDPTITHQVNSRKQATAFPPNYIHSLDATHMMMSAIECKENGLTFASVHDSFWTHPSDIDTLNRILRDAFVELHSEDLMAKLQAEFEVRYKDHWNYHMVKTNTTEGMAIKKAMEAYMKETGISSGRRKLTPSESLRWEIDRQRLLASEDPEERKKGEAMVTPSVIMSGVSRSTITNPTEDPPSLFEIDQKEKGVAVGLKGVMGDDVVPELEEVVPDVDEMIPEMDEEVDDNEKDELALDGGEVTEVIEADGGAIGSTVYEESSTTMPSNYVGFWLPLQLPPIPDRGSFDVSRLKASKYFFS